MKIVNKLMMLSIGAGSIPKSKEFYADKLGLKVTKDYRIDDDNWWVGLALSEGGATITLARAKGFPNVKQGTVSLYFETPDVAAAHKKLKEKGVKVNAIMDDLFGPGSGVKFFNFEDPDGNLVHLAQAHEYTPSTPF